MITIEKEAVLFSESDEEVECIACAHRCVISPGGSGICRVRVNRDGKLYSIVYNNLASLDFNYIEKGPIYHFYPGSRVVELGTVGCNFTCKFCCAWSISQVLPGEVTEIEIEPEKVAEAAKREGCKGIVFTHTDPIVSFEYVYDTARFAKEKGLFNVLVTNGYLTPEALDMIAPYIDAMSITPKSFTGDFYRDVCGGSIEPVMDTIKLALEKGIHVEIAYVLIPGHTDSDEDIKKLSNFLVELDPEIPVTFLRYFPSFDMDDIPMTLEEDMNRARDIAMGAGLKYVYLGNTYSSPGKHTYCPKCKAAVIERVGERVVEYRLKDGKCPECGEGLPIVGDYVPPAPPYF
ncbi:AmmeMemoRadiSam system radical SAM enzyme [archaeon]|nr:AmmeMemoRadiSam system radical SAM enzyme [archaeon]